MIINNDIITDNNSNKIKVVKNFGRYSIIQVYSNNKSSLYRSVYTSKDELLEYRELIDLEEKNNDITVGYCLYDNTLGFVPSDAKDWHDSIDSAEWEYSNFYETKREPYMNGVRGEVVQILEDNLKDLVLNHISSHMTIYYGKSIKEMEYYLDVNYDSSPEYEFIEEKIKKPLTPNECIYVASSFNKQVLDFFKNGCNHLLN